MSGIANTGVPGHRVEYTGGRVSGYAWDCSCGASSDESGGPLPDRQMRTEEAAEHLEAVVSKD